MTNSEKIQILKYSIMNIIKNSMRVDEPYLFNFAKQQAKEMRIEITKGEIKSIVYDILNTISFSSSNDSNEQCDDLYFSHNTLEKLIENAEFFIK